MSEYFSDNLKKFESIKLNMKIEMIKNRILLILIKKKKEEINLNKYNISEFSLLLKKQKIGNNISKIKKELEENYKNINQENKRIKKEIEKIKNEYNNIFYMLENNIKQLEYIKTTAEEQNFIIENKLKEKNTLIKNIKNIICGLSIGFRQFEIIEGIDNEYYKKEGSFEKETEIILEEEREAMNEYYIINLMKQNRLINQNKKLEKEKNILYDYILKYKNKKYKEDYNDADNNNEIIFQTNISTDDSNSSDSLYLDTDDQMDIKLIDKDLSNKKKELNNKKIIIPPLDLRLINYNKENDLSYKEKSLSRKIFELSNDDLKNENNIEENIDKLKSLIKYLKKKNKNLENKCKKYEDKISKIALSLYSK